MKLNELKNKCKALTLDTQYGELKIEYCPGEYTPEIEGLITDGVDKPLATTAELLGRMIVQWDIEDDDGKPLPVNMNTLMKLPLDLLLVMVKGITEDARPNVVNAPA